jgi:tripartite-type tricarboxylate transporter receptor subunit TctC
MRTPVTVHRREFFGLAAAAAALGVTPRTARADDYPSRVVRIIVATTPGGGTDLAARLLAQWLSAKFGQSFVVDNRPGGNNNIGTEFVAHAAPDGYTLFMANTVNAINSSLGEKLNYDFIADFAPVVHVVQTPLLMMVHPSLPPRTVPDFIAYAKANTLTLASGGTGSSGHMSAALFEMMAGVRMVHVPYRGESLALNDLIGGQAQVLFATTGSSLAQAQAGSVRALAVTTPEPLPALPGVPPLSQFLPGYVSASWSGLCAPRATPAAVVATLNREINLALADPTIKQRIADISGTSPGGSSADFARFIAEDTARWAKVAAFAGIKAD